MDDKRSWPEGFWEKLRADSEALPDDHQVPEPLPGSPHRDAVIDEWIASMAADSEESVDDDSTGGKSGQPPAVW